MFYFKRHGWEIIYKSHLGFPVTLCLPGSSAGGAIGPCVQRIKKIISKCFRFCAECYLFFNDLQYMYM